MTKPLRYAIYTRKSQEQDDRQVLSIPAQLKECQTKFAELHPKGIGIEESRSAKSPGRPLFNALLDQVEQGHLDGFIAWHPDRLSRNSVDTGRVIYLLDIGKLQDLKFCSYSFENTPEGKWMLSMIMGQAKYQVDKLSVDVDRGNREKYEKGGITWRAMPGYRNNKGEKTIEPDPERFPLVRRMWDLLLSGGYTVPEIYRTANRDWGYRTPPWWKKCGNRPLALSSLYLIFRNPLYASMNIRPDGTVYQSSHQPMITVEEFWQAQKILGYKGRARPKQGSVTPYTDRLMRCGECGCSITVERKRKTLKNGKILNFEYYRCTKKRGPCSQRYLGLKSLEEQLETRLLPVNIGIDCLAWSKDYLKEVASKETELEISVESSKERTVAQIDKELKNLSVMRRKEHIEEVEFIDQRAELLVERATLLGHRPQSDEPAWLAPALDTLDFGCGCSFWFSDGGPADKKIIIQTIGGSDLILFNRELNFEPVGPFNIMARHSEYAEWCTFADDIRTYFTTSPQIEWPYLPNLEKTFSR